MLTSASFARALPADEWNLEENPPRPIRGVREPVTTFRLLGSA
jgi:class 3 adenylate cyclase